MSNFITLTVVTTELKKEVQENILKNLTGVKPNSNSKKDSYGRNADFYSELGIDIPDDLVEDEYEEVEGEDNELYEVIEAQGIFRPETITFAVSNKDIGSTIYIDVDYKISVKESLEEIQEKINNSTNK